MALFRTVRYTAIHQKLKRGIPRRFLIHISFFFLVWILITVISKLIKAIHSDQKSVDTDSNERVPLQNPYIFRKGLLFNKNGFTLGGEPFRIISGSFHYFRTEPQQWEDRLLKMKAAGLNTVTTYIPWNLHETYSMEYHFKGKWNIEEFIQLVDKMGLYLIVRPGPFISAEWENGGLPSWLLGDSLLVERDSSCDPFLHYVERYFAQLLPLLVPYQYQGGGGSIIAFQIENEYGSYRRDPVYMSFVKEQFEKNGLTELFYTSDIASGLTGGSMEKVLAAINFKENPNVNLIILKNLNVHLQLKMPLMVGEFWDGSFDQWAEKHHKTPVVDTVKIADTILSSGSSLNFYMFVGGTNFGFWNGANKGDQYKPITTSYDYDAPISECGDITPKYLAIRKLLQKLNLNGKDLPDIPKNSSKANYGLVEIEQCMSYTDMLSHIKDKITLQKPKAMEYLPFNNESGQAYGWLLYRTKFSKGNTLKFMGIVKDRAQVILNGKLIAVLDWFQSQNYVKLKNLKVLNQLDIFVENTGRVNHRYKTVYKPQRRGILGQVLIDNQEIHKWEHIPFEFKPKFMSEISRSSHWKHICHQNALPSLYRGTLLVESDPKDTFINMKKWTKGIVFINGFNLGRYWHVGPQQTLYVPHPLLQKGGNSVVVFELHQSYGNVKFLDYPILDENVPERNPLDIA